jgi:hypothetical protein
MPLIHDRLAKLEAAIQTSAPSTLHLDDDVATADAQMRGYIDRYGRLPSVVVYPPGMPRDAIELEGSRAVVVMLPNNGRERPTDQPTAAPLRAAPSKETRR